MSSNELEQGHKDRDLHCDHWLVPAEGSLSEVSERVFWELESGGSRSSRVRQDALLRRRAITKCLIGNMALLTACRGRNACLVYPRSKASLKSRYERSDLPRQAFNGVVDCMVRSGFVEQQIGTKGGLRSTLKPTEMLRSLLPTFGEDLGLRRLQGAETILLSAKVGRHKGQRVWIEYDDNEDTLQKRSEMDRINEALNSVVITFGSQKQPPVHLVRMFQVETPNSPPSFCLHGRLHRGYAWEYLPKLKRHLLAVDGEKLVELDFSSLFVRLGYAELGIRSEEDDPYDDMPMERSAAKVLMSVLLSKTGPLRQLPDHLADMLGDCWNGHRATVAAARRHPQLANLFGKGAGLRLMFKESQILVAILLKLIDRGAIALPLHDGLLIPEHHADICEEIMEKTSTEFIGWPLPVKRKLIPLP